MLRRLSAPTACSSSFVSGYRKGLLSARSNRSSIRHVVNHSRLVLGRTVRYNTKPDSIVQSINTSASFVMRMRSLTSFHGTFQNHEEQENAGNEEQDDDDEVTMQPLMMEQDEEWLDTTTIIHSSEQSMIMARIEKEIPLLVQDYLAVSDAAAASSSSSNPKDADKIMMEERQDQYRHGITTSLAARYQKELNWIMRRMAREHVITTTTTTSSSSSSFSSVVEEEQHAGYQISLLTTGSERTLQEDANNDKWQRASSVSVLQDSIHDDGDDVSCIDDEKEDIKPREAHLAESSGATTNNHHRHGISSRQQESSLITTTTKRSTRLVLLHSCLALLHAMSRHDWAVVDDQSLLLTDDDDEHEQCALQESKYDPDVSSTIRDKGLQAKVDDDDDMNDNLDLDDVDDDELFWTLRQLKLGGVALESTNDYNLVLARIALAAELDHDDILEALFDTLRQIKAAAAAAAAASSSSSSSSSSTCAADSGPNATTYEIVLLIMVKRLGAFRSALDLVRRDMIQTLSLSSSASPSPFSSRLCTTGTLEAAIQVCEKVGDLPLARELWRIAKSKNAAHDVVNIGDDNDSNANDRAQVRISNRVHHSMLNMFKAVDARDEAIETLSICLRDNGRQINTGLDRVFVNAINWPNRNRKGEPIDNLPVLVSILDLLDDDALYKPDSAVLRQLLILVARGARQDNHHTRWKVVHRIVQKMFNSFPAFHVDEAVLSIGVEASEALSDSALAAEVITRMLDGEFGQTLCAHNQTNRFVAQHQPSRNSTIGLLSSKNILKAMGICVNSGDAASARRILDCVEEHHDAAQIPRAIRQRLFVSTLKVYATVGQVQVAEELLLAMLSSDVEPTEEAVGSVIHGYVLTKSLEKARGLWNDMKSGRFGVDIVSGGPTVYNAVILDCIQNNSWSDAREMYDEMKKSRVVPLDSTYVGLLLASFKEGGRRKTMQFIDELVQSRVSVTAGICMMALRLLIPEIAKLTEFADMRSQLQSLSNDKESVYVALIRAIRSAELEEQRQSTKGLPRAKINERRAAAWHEVLKQLTRSSAALFPDEDEGAKSVSS